MKILETVKILAANLREFITDPTGAVRRDAGIDEVLSKLKALGCEDIPKRLEQAVMLESVNAKPAQVAEFVHALASGAISDGFMRRMRHSGIRDMTTRPGVDSEIPYP